MAATASSVSTQILDQLIGKLSSEKQEINQNHELCKAVAKSIAVEIGDIPQTLLQQQENNDILDTAQVQEFFEQQRKRLKVLADANAEREQTLQAFGATLATLKQEDSGAETYYEKRIQTLMEQHKQQGGDAQQSKY